MCFFRLKKMKLNLKGTCNVLLLLLNVVSNHKHTYEIKLSDVSGLQEYATYRTPIELI